MQPQSGAALITADVQSHTQASSDEQTPHSSEDSIELLLQVLGQSTATIDQNIMSTSTTLLAHDLPQPTLVNAQHSGRLVSSHGLLEVSSNFPRSPSSSSGTTSPSS
jgi:hypothetical protein